MEQLELEFDAPEANPGKVVKSVHTDLGGFGTRTDVFEFGDDLREHGLIECADPNVRFFNQHSAAPTKEVR